MLVNQPKNTDIKAQQVKVNLAWSKTFGKDRTQKFETAQMFIDSECIRRMVKYTPAKNNILYKSVTIGTKIGKGKLFYANPYARFIYYGQLMVSSVTGSAFARGGEKKVLALPQKDLNFSKSRHPEAQKLWFEVMKKEHGEAIRRGAVKVSGGKII